MLPHFLGLGAQKAASTWLYEMLKQHPQIWMPPIKELHFFDIPGEASHFSNVVFRRKGYRKSWNRLKHTSKRNTLFLRFFFLPRTLKNYKLLFSPSKGQTCGEITSGYANLPLEKIKYIRQHLPDVKLIYILRNPIHRDWSSISMLMTQKGWTIKSIPTKILQKKLKKRLSHSHYVLNIQNWEKHFPKEQIFISFFEEIEQAPIRFLERLFEFLELDKIDMQAFQKLATKKVNSHSLQNIPDLSLIHI